VLSVGDMIGRESTCSVRAGSCKSPASLLKTPRGEQSFHAMGYAINGISAWAQKWVSILERWTGRRHLKALTLLPLRDTLSDMLLFKSRRAWCSECYEDDRKTGVVHERLLWALDSVSVCPVHTTRLAEKCSFCSEASAPLSAHSRPGYCSSCGCWLGKQGTASRPNANRGGDAYEVYVAVTAGELLARCSTLRSKLSRARFSANLRTCIDRLTSGNTGAFAHLTRTSRSAVRDWASGKMRQRLDVLIRVGFHLGIPADCLLTSRRLDGVDWAAVKEYFPRDDRGVKTSRTSEEVRALLKKALRDNEAVSVPELSRRLGYKRYERLYQVDAALCHRITAKHRASTRTHWWKQPGAKRICEIDAIQSALEQSWSQDPPVPVRRIAMQLGYTNGGFIHRRFPHLCHAIAEKLENYQKRRLVKGAVIRNHCGGVKGSQLEARVGSFGGGGAPERSEGGLPPPRRVWEGSQARLRRLCLRR
jgi:hypothetical protein